VPVGASVETELTESNVVPGGVVQGEVRLQGGSVNQRIEGLNIGLQARVEVEGGDQESKQNIEFTKENIGGAFEVQAGRRPCGPVRSGDPVGDPDHDHRRAAAARDEHRGDHGAGDRAGAGLR
jgi:sporulation-control protein spo0M